MYSASGLSVSSQTGKSVSDEIEKKARLTIEDRMGLQVKMKGERWKVKEENHQITSDGSSGTRRREPRLPGKSKI
jgi:hypothetical protein